MTIGLGRRLALLLLGGTFCVSVSAQDDLLESVLYLIGEHRVYHADYVEKKHLSFLDVPLSHSGHLSFYPPDKLVRKQHSPKAQTFTITGRQLTMETSGQSKQMAVNRVPGLQPFVSSMLAVLSGNVTQLQRHYKVEVSGGINSWLMKLVPRDEQLRTYIESIHFSGRQGRITRIKVYEVGGGWSDMMLTAASPNDVD